MILFVKHIEIEGPETLGAFFDKRGFSTKTIDLSLGQSLPEKFSGLQAVIVLGGPMNVYEEDKFPFLKKENIFIQKAVEKEIPFLGICLGSQLLAKACGARVIKAQVPEIGLFDVRLTDDGKKDPLFAGVPQTLKVFQWHGDTFEIPKGGRWLVEGKQCSHQAFRVGRNAYGLQFHIEVTAETIVSWCGAYLAKDPLGDQKARMIREYNMCQEKFQAQAKQVYDNFVKIML